MRKIISFIRRLHIHIWDAKKWRLVHYYGNPLELCIGAECSICGKRKLFHKCQRDGEWENKNKDLFDNSLWDVNWE